MIATGLAGEAGPCWVALWQSANEHGRTGYGDTRSCDGRPATDLAAGLADQRVHRQGYRRGLKGPTRGGVHHGAGRCVGLDHRAEFHRSVGVRSGASTPPLSTSSSVVPDPLSAVAVGSIFRDFKHITAHFTLFRC